MANKFKILFTLVIIACFSFLGCNRTSDVAKDGKVSPKPKTTRETSSVDSSGSKSSILPTTTSSQQGSPLPSLSKESMVEDYFPFEEKLYRKYRGEGNEFADYMSYIDFVKDDLIQERRINGGTTSVYVFKINKGELLQVYSQGEMYKKEDCTGRTNMKYVLLKEPIKVGTSWKNTEDRITTITGVDKLIKTPLGEYSCVEVSDLGEDNVFRTYYAKGFGLVKTEYKGTKESFIVTQEIEEVKKGLDWKESNKSNQ